MVKPRTRYNAPQQLYRRRNPYPQNGYRAYLIEVELTSPTGDVYELSTEARVTPDALR
ncbi:MAG: hypothetical protein ACREV4_05415 [Gammaproteobacteria bacterium]